MFNIERRTVVLLCGSSCVGKSTLIQNLEKEGWESYRISARDAIKGAPHHFGTYPPYEQMISSPQVGFDIQNHIYQNFRNSLNTFALDLIKGNTGQRVITERCLYDPILYTLAYSCLGNWGASPYYRALITQFTCMCVSEHTAFVTQLQTYGFAVYQVYVPVQPRVIPYDRQNGARPPLGVRDMFNTVFKENKLLFNVDLMLTPGTAEDYVKQIEDFLYIQSKLTV